MSIRTRPLSAGLAGGGAPGVYKIQRRQDGAAWENIGISTAIRGPPDRP